MQDDWERKYEVDLILQIPTLMLLEWKDKKKVRLRKVQKTLPQRCKIGMQTYM